MLGGLLAVLGLGAACSSVESASTRTSDITADIVVSASKGGGVTFSVQLSKGSLHAVDLTGDDKLVGETTNYKVTLEKTKFLGQVSYRGQIFSEEPKPGDELTVRLERGGGATSAVSTVTVPEDLVVSAPATGSFFSRGKALHIDVSQAPGAFRVNWTGECIAEDSAGAAFAQGAPIVIAANALKPADPEHPKQNCAVTFSISRLLEGTLDPAFKGGRIHGERSIQLDLMSRA